MEFLEICLESLHTCSVSPCQPVNEWCAFKFSVFVRWCLLNTYLGLKESDIVEKEQIKKHPSLTDRQGLMEHVCKYHGLYLKNGVDFWTLVRKARVICVVVLVSIWDQLWALNQTWHWPYAVRSSNICTKLSHTCLGVPGIGSSRKKNGDKIYLIT